VKKLIFAIIISHVPIYLWGQSDTGFVRKIYENLRQIKSASYFWDQSASAIYDTVPSVSYRVFKKEFDNPDDKLVGAFIASFQVGDTTRLVYFYDGKVQSYLDWENQTIPVDSFQHDRYPFRIVYPPFFTHVKSLLKYALETTDSVTMMISDFQDSVRIRMSVQDKLVEVVGNRIVYADPADASEERWTVYEIWISRSNDLPYRMVKKFPDRVCWEVCRQIRIDTAGTTKFAARDYFPAGFAVTAYGEGEPARKNLEGIVAPAWKLKDTEGHETALADLTGKVLLVQFTGIGCGPCYQSIPCLVKLRDQFKRGDFEIVSIETWNTNPAVIKKHMAGNRINYLYLIGDQAVKQNYANRSVPQFFVLDEYRVIRKIITGFDKEKTCTELKEIVDQLVQ